MPRRLFEVEGELLLSPHILPILPELNFSEQYRRELSQAFSEVFLLQERAAVISVMFNRPLKDLRDPGKIARARAACNGQDPVLHHLDPLLAQLGQPPI
jgi:hypothetical protein